MEIKCRIQARGSAPQDSKADCEETVKHLASLTGDIGQKAISVDGLNAAEFNCDFETLCEAIHADRPGSERLRVKLSELLKVIESITTRRKLEGDTMIVDIGMNDRLEIFIDEDSMAGLQVTPEATGFKKTTFAPPTKPAEEFTNEELTNICKATCPDKIVKEFPGLDKYPGQQDKGSILTRLAMVEGLASANQNLNRIYAKDTDVDMKFIRNQIAQIKDAIGIDDERNPSKVHTGPADR